MFLKNKYLYEYKYIVMIITARLICASCTVTNLSREIILLFFFFFYESFCETERIMVVVTLLLMCND